MLDRGSPTAALAILCREIAILRRRVTPEDARPECVADWHVLILIRNHVKAERQGIGIIS